VVEIEMRRWFKIFFPLIIFLAFSGCGLKKKERKLTVIFGTRLGDSGFAYFIQERFEKKYNIKIQPRYRCMEEAFKEIKEEGIDVLLHAHPDMEKLEKAGIVVERRKVAESDWVLVGPPDDPAGAGKCKDILKALEKIYENKARFLSRGDLSCENVVEEELWRMAGYEPRGKWYIVARLSNKPSLRMASQMGCYYLADRPTFLAEKDFLNLKILVEGGEILKDVWEVMIINPKRFRGVNYRDAIKFVEFVTSPEFQNEISKFGVEEYGYAPYKPLALESKSGKDGENYINAVRCRCSPDADARMAEIMARDYANDHKKLGDRYFKEGKLEDAKLSYHRAISIDPTFTEAYYMLGKVYLKLNQPEKAREIWEKGLEENPGDKRLIRALKRLLRK